MKLYFYINNFKDNKGIEMEECEVRETATRYYPINNFPKGFCNYHAYVNKSDIGIVISHWGQNTVIIKEPDFELAKRLFIEQMEKEIEAEKDEIEKLKEKIKEKENNIKIIEESEENK